MKKSVIAIIVVLVLVLVVIPNVIGSRIQTTTVDTLLAMVPAEASNVLNIQQTEFRRGWFSSSAELEISIDEVNEIAGEPVYLILDMDINHGPLLFTPDGIRFGIAHANVDPSVLV